MPINDWTRIPAGIFHDFHHEWITAIKHSLNHSLSGTDYYALAEQIAGGVEPDVLTLQHPHDGQKPEKRPGDGRQAGVALKDAPPKTKFRITNPPLWFANKKKAVTIRHVSEHRVVAMLEIVSPGNKSSKSALAAFVRKAEDLLSSGVHLDIIDLFPPTPRDSEGIHIAVWGEDEGFCFDPAKPLTCASYIGGVGAQAFVEPVAVGDELPTIPLFVTTEEYVDVPLEATYMSAFENVPDFWRKKL